MFGKKMWFKIGIQQFETESINKIYHVAMGDAFMQDKQQTTNIKNFLLFSK